MHWVELQAPSWHGYFVLKLASGCDGCGAAVKAVERVSYIAYQDHELRICAAFTVVDAQAGGQVSADPEHLLLAAARRPVLYWIPPLHEQHALHAKPMVRCPFLTLGLLG